MVWFGNWNIRKLVLSGKSKEFNLHYVRANEMASQLAKKEWNSTVAIRGKRTFPEYIQIADLNGYNLREVGCLACMYLLIVLLISTRNLVARLK